MPYIKGIDYSNYVYGENKLSEYQKTEDKKISSDDLVVIYEKNSNDQEFEFNNGATDGNLISEKK